MNATTLATKALLARGNLLEAGKGVEGALMLALGHIHSARIAAGAVDANSALKWQLADQMDAIKLQVETGNYDLAMARLVSVADQAGSL